MLHSARAAAVVRLLLVLAVTSSVALTGCRKDRPAGGSSPSPTPSCVSDEMGRSPCPATTTVGSASGAAGSEDSADEEDEREEYAEKHEECQRIRERYGFYPFKFCARYGDEEY